MFLFTFSEYWLKVWHQYKNYSHSFHKVLNLFALFVNDLQNDMKREHTLQQAQPQYK